MLNISEIEVAIVKKIQSELPTVYCEIIPDNGANSVIQTSVSNENGSVFVQYAGTEYGTYSTSYGEEFRAYDLIRYIIYVCSTDYNSENSRRNVKMLLEKIENILKNWEYERGAVIELVSDEFNSEINGVWIYTINLSTKRIFTG